MNKFADPSPWKLILLAGAILLITMGVRQTVGLFVGPLEHGTGIDVATISLILAIGQFMW